MTPEQLEAMRPLLLEFAGKAYREGMAAMREQAAQVLAACYDAGAASLVRSLPIPPLESKDAPKD